MEEFMDSDFDPDADIEGDLITIIGSAFFQPIADLIDKLAACKPKSLTSPNVGFYENGYSVSIVILLVLAFESYISRMSYLQHQKTGETRPQRPKQTPPYIHCLAPEFPLLEELNDVYVVRDSLAHGQLWSVEYVIRPDRSEVTKRELFAGFGDSKMRQRVDLDTGKTKHLGCNVLPTSIGATDAATVFRVLAMSLDSLIKAGLIEKASVRGHACYDKRTVEFWSLNKVLTDIAAR
jgi:hypothetical protein